MLTVLKKFSFAFLFFGVVVVRADTCTVYIEATTALHSDPVIRWDSKYFTSKLVTDAEKGWDIFASVLQHQSPQQKEVVERARTAGKAQMDVYRRKIENRTNLFRNGYRWRLEGNHAYMPKAGDILVVGCANGSECGHLALTEKTRRIHYANMDKDAIEITRQELDFVSRLATNAVVGQSYEVDIGTATTIPKLAFDGVVMNDTFAFVNPENRERTIATLAASMRPGGVIIIHDVGMNYRMDFFVMMRTAIQEMLENGAEISEYEMALLAASHIGLFAELHEEDTREYYGVVNMEVQGLLERNGSFKDVKVEYLRGGEFRVTATKK